MGGFVHFGFQNCFAPQRSAIFISHLAIWPCTRRAYFSTLRNRKSLEKNTVNRDFPTFSRAYLLSSHFFDLLSLSLPLSLLLFSILTISTFAFPCVHIVGSLTCKLPSIMIGKIMFTIVTRNILCYYVIVWKNVSQNSRQPCADQMRNNALVCNVVNLQNCNSGWCITILHGSHLQHRNLTTVRMLTYPKNDVFFCSVDFKHVGNLCGFRACCIQMQVFLSICCGNLKLRAVVSANRAKWPSIPPCRCGPQLWVILINFLKSVTFMCIYSVLPIYVEHFDTNESIND